MRIRRRIDGRREIVCLIPSFTKKTADQSQVTNLAFGLSGHRKSELHARIETQQQNLTLA
jgi:hypothetical protein